MARAPNGQEPLSPSNSGALAEAAAAIPITPPLESTPLESGPSGAGVRSPDSPRSPLDGTSSSSAADTSPSPAPPAAPRRPATRRRSSPRSRPSSSHQHRLSSLRPCCSRRQVPRAPATGRLPCSARHPSQRPPRSSLRCLRSPGSSCGSHGRLLPASSRLQRRPWRSRPGSRSWVQSPPTAR